MKRACGWILYDDPDYAVNQSFAAHIVQAAEKRGFVLETVLLSQLLPGMENGHPVCTFKGKSCRPDFIISRQRDSSLSEHFEGMGIAVSNNAKACRI